MNPKLLAALGAIVILAISHGYAFFKGRGYEKTKWELKVAENKDKARAAQDELQEKHDEAVKDYLKKLNGYRVFTDALIVSLRDRPDRVSDTPRAGCAGGTGAELSRRDAEVLARQAARADEQRAANVFCQDAYDRARKALIEFNKSVQ